VLFVHRRYTALVASIVEAQQPIAVGAIIRSIIVEDERRRILAPLVANQRLKDVSVSRFLARDDTPNPVFGLDVSPCLVEEVAVTVSVPARVAIVELNFVERIVVEVEEGTLQEPLGNTFNDQTLPVANFLAIDDARLHALEAVFKPLGGLSPSKVEWNLDLLNRPGRLRQRPAEKSCAADQTS
jgi:hypothetical protein